MPKSQSETSGGNGKQRAPSWGRRVASGEQRVASSSWHPVVCLGCQRGGRESGRRVEQLARAKGGRKSVAWRWARTWALSWERREPVAEAIIWPLWPLVLAPAEQRGAPLCLVCDVDQPLKRAFEMGLRSLPASWPESEHQASQKAS